MSGGDGERGWDGVKGGGQSKVPANVAAECGSLMFNHKSKIRG